MCYLQEIKFLLRSKDHENKSIYSINTHLNNGNSSLSITAWEDSKQLLDLIYPSANTAYELFSKILDNVLDFSKNKNLELFRIDSSSDFHYLKLDQLNEILNNKDFKNVEIVNI